MIQHPHTLNSNNYLSNKRVAPPVFHLDASPVLGLVLVLLRKPMFWFKKAELIWFLFLNILSFSFVPTPNEYLRFTRFRSYVKHTAVVLIKFTL